jgi:hypothetical protein
MRGFPLMNFLLVLGVLGLGGLVLARVTQVPSEAPQVAARRQPPAAAASIPTRVEVLLSAPAASIEIASLDGVVLCARQPQEPRMVTSLDLPAGLRGLRVRVAWKDAPGGHRFAKVVLEPQRLPTVEHVFDAGGDLDDVWEFPPLTLPSL